MFSFLLGVFLGVEFLGDIVTLCLTFWRTTRWFSIILHSHWQWMSVLTSPHPHHHILFSDFLTKSILVGMKWYLIEILTVSCIFLMQNGIEYLFFFEYLFMCLLAICIFSLEKCLLNSFVNFWLGCILLFSWESSLCILNTNYLSMQYFLASCGLSFHILDGSQKTKDFNFDEVQFI